MGSRTFVEAFTTKYLDQDSDDFPSELNDSGIIILCPRNKLSDVSLLRRVVLDNEGITDAGDCGQIADKLQHCRELDLSANQLASWSQVEEILKFMPSLEFLNLASTSLSNSSRDEVGGSCRRMDCVKILILNNTRLPWDTALRVLETFPSVEELHLGLNEYSSIPQPSSPTSFNSVHRLYFNDNGVARWSELTLLGELFPNIECLFLVKNPLVDLTEDVGCHFGHLKQLSILDTALSSWEEIDSLNHFPELVEVQLRGIPLTEGIEEKEFRQLAVSRLAKMTRLNNSLISESERENAERFFIRTYMDAPDKPKRYEELAAIHKNVNKLAHVDMDPITDASLLIKYGSKVVQMDVSTEQTCWQLRKSLANHFKVSHELIQLHYHDGRYEGGHDEMTDDQATLKWYCVKDGDEILVKDLPEPRERQVGRYRIVQHAECSFVEAFTTKYLEDEEVEQGRLISAPLKRPAGALKLVILNQQSITSAGDCERIAEMLRDVTELELSGNNLGSWNEVEVILQYMPRLEKLNLMMTELSGQGEVASDMHKESVKRLMLVGTNIPWIKAISAVLPSFPCLEEVHLSLNNYSAVPEPPASSFVFPTVRQLYFNDNNVQAWSDVVFLGKLFPNLDCLHLVRNPITGLTEDIGSHFACLKQLSIFDSGLSTWEEVDNLQYFPKLVKVQLDGSRLFNDMEEEEARKLLVARLPKVTRLNNSLITESDRELAELDFIRRFMDNPEKPKRYEELRRIHPNVHSSASIELEPTKDVTVTIRYGETSMEMTLSTVQTFWDLKKKLARQFGLPTSKTRLFYVDTGMNSDPEELKVPNANLYQFNMHDGDEIIVERKK